MDYGDIDQDLFRSSGGSRTRAARSARTLVPAVRPEGTLSQWAGAGVSQDGPGSPPEDQLARNETPCQCPPVHLKGRLPESEIVKPTSLHGKDGFQAIRNAGVAVSEPVIDHSRQTGGQCEGGSRWSVRSPCLPDVGSAEPSVSPTRPFPFPRRPPARPLQTLCPAGMPGATW